MNSLIEKYNVAAPRYTSYPTVPYWNEEAPSEEQWKMAVKNTFETSNDSDGISLYIHLPFCESLCTYCGCNTRITKNHNVEIPYLEAVLKEWDLYLNLFESTPKIKEIHLGGGTPTFFSPQHLSKLLHGILSKAILLNNAELSFEAHPNNTSAGHLTTLYEIGFKRLSLGIQDFDPKVQHIIHRIQTYESVKNVTDLARKIGYTSINYDLIYGLPLQTQQSIQQNIQKVIDLHPDRIAFYSYAHVPWIKGSQRKFTEADLPQGEEKRILYETGREAFEKAGYVEIGMDHFALPNDELHIAEKNKNLHRNFMGYTSSHTKLLVALGASSISDAWGAFVQNEKKVEDYYKKINEGVFPFFKGHILSEEDKIIRQHILNIMCRQQTAWHNKKDQCSSLYNAIERWKEMEKDELIQLHPFELNVTSKGRAFLRNICMALDAGIWKKQTETKLFSKAI